MKQGSLLAQGPVDVNVSPLPCPFCGKPMHDNGEMGEDTFYPSGTGWKFDEDLQMRTYHSFRDVPKEQWCWVLHCATNYGGCGAEMHGDAKYDTLAKWNRRANVELTGDGQLHRPASE